MRPNPPTGTSPETLGELSKRHRLRSVSASISHRRFSPACRVPGARAVTVVELQCLGPDGVPKSLALNKLIHGKFHEPQPGAKYRDLAAVPVLLFCVSLPSESICLSSP